MMYPCLTFLLLIASIPHVANTASVPSVLGGWQASSNGQLENATLALARTQLASIGNNVSLPIQVISFSTQVVAGTNTRLIFTVGGQRQCTLVAFQPLPYTQQPMQLTTFSCDEVTTTSTTPTYNCGEDDDNISASSTSSESASSESD